MRRIVLTTFAIVLLAVLINKEAVSQSVGNQSLKTNDNQEKAGIIEKIKRYPSIRNNFENAYNTPLLILNSSSKEISKDEYRDLVGLTATSNTLVSFPDVTLVNNSDKPINSFILLLTNKQSKAMPFLKASGVNIQPHNSYFVNASRWLRGDKRSNRPPDLDSEKMWLLGSASDLTVRVAQVIFSDNSKWVMEDAPVQSSNQLSRVEYFNKVSFSVSSLTKSSRSVPFSCTCSCGVTCHSGGGWDCTGDGGNCNRYQEAINCINSCCAAAATAEGCGRYGGIL